MPNGAKASQAQAAAAAEAAQKDPKNKFILVPSDHALANTPCPICQEPFEKSYDDSVSDWVWKDAVKIGSKVYHASEYAELKSDGGHTPNRTSTPDSVLGKRGREVSAVSGVLDHPSAPDCSTSSFYHEQVTNVFYRASKSIRVPRH